jgi:hypothetical protein
MSVDSIEASEQDSSPRELIDIVYGATSIYITTATRDIAYGGNVYRATAAARGEIGPDSSGNGKEMALTLPIDHAFVRRYLRSGVPPQTITVTLRRYYSASDVEIRWIGEITSMSVDNDNTEASFRVESAMSKHMLRVIPNVTVGKSCPHMLYDAMCGIDEGDSNPDGFAYKLTTTVLYVDGREVRVDLSHVTAGHALREDWCVNGKLVHVATGEAMPIGAQDDLSPGVSTVTTLTMQLPIPELKIGDSVEVYAGCQSFAGSYSIATCNEKFANKLRFGGQPQLPTKNPFVPSSYGVGNET